MQVYDSIQRRMHGISISCVAYNVVVTQLASSPRPVSLLSLSFE